MTPNEFLNKYLLLTLNGVYIYSYYGVSLNKYLLLTPNVNIYYGILCWVFIKKYFNKFSLNKYSLLTPKYDNIIDPNWGFHYVFINEIIIFIIFLK